jgi:membrane fusion protein, multidrug efflux system
MSAAALERPALLAVPDAPTKRKLPFSSRTLAIVGVAVVAASGGTALILTPKTTVSTDAAYLEADSTVVAPRVRGLVAQVLVADNQHVRKGEPLVAIDPEEFDARVAQASADLSDAQAAVAAANAALVSLNAEEQLAASNVRAARSSISSAEAQAAVAETDRARYDALLASGFVPRREADRVRAVAVTAASDAERRRAELDVSRNQASVVGARRATLQAALAKAQASVVRAEAALNLARQDQGHTLIRAPIDGVVGDRKVEMGAYVQPGSRLLTVVPLNALYLTANFKETQTARMTVGQPVSIKVDALPGVTLKGRVESFAPGSGSQFSLLPFEPGTGNFTKIVQRVPVRIRLDPGQPQTARLRPGLSATAKVRLSD